MHEDLHKYYPASRSVSFALVVFVIISVSFVMTFAGALQLRMRSDEALVLGAAVALGGFLVYTVLYAVVMLTLRWVRQVAVDRVVMAHIANIFRQKLPLAQAMEVAGWSETGPAGARLRGVASFLAAGLPLSEAVREGWPACPSVVLSLLIAGEKTGQLSMAVEQSLEYLTWQARRRHRTDIPVTPYALVLILATGFMTAGMMVVIIPKFKEIFRDFGAQLPGSTVALINVSTAVSETMRVFLILFALAAIAGIYLGFLHRRVPQPRLTTRIADWVKWNIPGLHRIELSRGLGVMMGVIRMGTLSGMDLSAAVALAAELDVNFQLRLLMRDFARRVAMGEDPRDSARNLGLGDVAGIALASGRRSGELGTALSYACDYHNALFSRAWILFTRLAWPLTTIALGVLVAFVVVAMFTPLIMLINSVTFR